MKDGVIIKTINGNKAVFTKYGEIVLEMSKVLEINNEKVLRLFIVLGSNLSDYSKLCEVEDKDLDEFPDLMILIIHKVGNDLGNLPELLVNNSMNGEIVESMTDAEIYKQLFHDADPEIVAKYYDDIELIRPDNMDYGIDKYGNPEMFTSEVAFKDAMKWMESDSGDMKQSKRIVDKKLLTTYSRHYKLGDDQIYPILMNNKESNILFIIVLLVDSHNKASGFKVIKVGTSVEEDDMYKIAKLASDNEFTSDDSDDMIISRLVPDKLRSISKMVSLDHAILNGVNMSVFK